MPKTGDLPSLEPGGAGNSRKEPCPFPVFRFSHAIFDAVNVSEAPGVGRRHPPQANSLNSSLLPSPHGPHAARRPAWSTK